MPNKSKEGSETTQLENKHVYLESDLFDKVIVYLVRALTQIMNSRSLAMLLNISGTTAKLTAGRRIGCATPVQKVFKNSSCKLCTDEVDFDSCSYPNKISSVEYFYTDGGLSSCSIFFCRKRERRAHQRVRCAKKGVCGLVMTIKKGNQLRL